MTYNELKLVLASYLAKNDFKAIKVHDSIVINQPDKFIRRQISLIESVKPENRLNHCLSRSAKGNLLIIVNYLES